MRNALISVSLMFVLACSGGEGDEGDGSTAGMDGGTITLPDGRVIPIPVRDSGGGTGYDGSLVPTGDQCDGPCACSDGLDNDDDGAIDVDDPECTGPTDNDEETFGTGIPGDNRDGAFQ